MLVLTIDGMNIIRRVYEAIPGDKDTPERADGAIKSITGSIKRAIKEVSPTHALCALDVTGKTWRHDIYPGYKASRKPAPQVLLDRLPDIISNIEDLGIKTLGMPRYEADDIIATLVTKLDKKDIPTVILSTDKDLFQLINGDKIISRNHFNKEDRNEQWVINKFGVKPQQIGDLLAMMGDKSDDIPGIPGVGQKRAAELLEIYGSLDEILHMKDIIPGTLGKNICENADKAKISQRLVSLETGLNLKLNLADLRLHAVKQNEGPVF